MKKIFISYSHEDAEFKEMLVKQLGVLHLAGLCSIWEDGRIQTGTDWNQEIKKVIDEADVAVLMVSTGFINSKFINEYEVPLILERKEKGELTVLPLFVKTCDWKNVPWLAKIQGFPSNGIRLSQCSELKQQEILLQFAGTIASYMKISTPGTAILLTPLPPRKIKLIGREKDLAALADMLMKSERVVLVNGLGGIGKTEVCKSFFYTHYNQYVYAAWIDWISSLKESLVRALDSDDSEFIQANEEDTIDERFAKIMARLRQTRESFLLVVDNIENPGDKGLNSLASLPEQVKVLVNSRSLIEGYETQCLDYLSKAECRALFYEFYKGKTNDETVDRIVELCGYHTLTVELLAKTAHHAAMKIESLYEALENKGFNLNEEVGEKVATTWHNETEKKPFFDHLVKVFDISGVTEEELSILVNLSVLPAVYIPIAWVHEWLKLKDNNAVTSLVEKGWLKRDEEARLYLHPVMQEVVRYRAKPDAKKCNCLIDSLKWKLYLKPGDNPILKKDFILYGESVVRTLAMELKVEDEALATLANNLSLRHLDMGQLDWASEFQSKALAIREAILDKNHPDLAKSYNNFSLILLNKGELDSALELQRKALDIRKAKSDKNYPELAKSYNTLSQIYREKGQRDEALAIQKKTIKITKSTSEINLSDKAHFYYIMSTIYKAKNNFAKSLGYQLEALKIGEVVWDNNHPSKAKAYNNLSLIYQAMGQLDRAMEFQLKALAIREAVLDKNHSELANSYNNVSLIYRDMGQPDRAMEFQRKALTIREEVLDNNHPDLANSYHNLSLLYSDMNDIASALPYAEKAVVIMQLNFPNGHPNLDIYKKNLEYLKGIK